MNPLQQLSDYLRRIERNLRLLTLARGAAVWFGLALATTFVLVLWMNRESFSNPSVSFSRVLLFFVLAAALCFGVIYPLMKLNQRRAAREAERRHPELSQRLLTFVERRQTGDPFLPLLAADTMPYTSAARPQVVAAPSIAIGFGAVALCAALVLIWMSARGPGYLGYGASLLWGAPKDLSKPFYSISLDPGNSKVRRHADQLVTAKLNGFYSQQASLFVRYQSASKWEEASMRPLKDGSAFQFLLVGVPEDLQYYVMSNGIRSDEKRISAVDLPSVKHLKVTLHFPPGYGLKDETDDPGGDIRAIQGTKAALEIETDKPLDAGYLVMDDGKRVKLSGSGATHTAQLEIEKDGAYHFATPDGSELVRLTDDYFIEARQDQPPVISISRPARDARATVIEEVPVEVQANDDYGVNALDLHYSVNGDPEQTRSLSGTRGKEARGSTLLSLEDFDLQPGDIVSFYATAKDARTTARSDIHFIEARPFEYDYHQSQAMGGQGQSGDQQPEISEREKDIIAATFNQLKSDKRDAAQESENAKYLSGVQSKLKDEAHSLSDRMRARQLEGGGAAFQQFVTNMDEAVAAMDPAAGDLKNRSWQDALAPEEKALQHLLRAEAIFRDIQVAFGPSGGGGGRNSGATRDLEGLANLELDTQKNQYETGNQSAEDEMQRKADDALKKLEELARRQQELARQPQSKQNFQQRWEQEMLRREAEQLKRQLQEMARDQQQNGQQGQQQNGQGQESGQQQSSETAHNGSPKRSGSQTGGKLAQGTRQTLDNAIRDLDEATKNMGDAASHGKQSEAQQAAGQLNRAQEEIGNMRQQQNGSSMSDLAQQASRLAEQQRHFEQQLRHSFGGDEAGNRSDEQNARLAQQMAQEKQREADDLHALEKKLQSAARELHDNDPAAAAKLRDAIGGMQQREVESRMKWTIDALNRGLGSYAVMREAPVTQALDELKDQIAGAQLAIKGPGGGGRDKDASAEAMRQALAQAEKLHRDLESAMKRPKGDEKGGGQAAEQSAENGRPGQQAGQNASREGQQQAQNGQPGQRQAQQGQQAQANSGGGPGFNQQGEENGRRGTWTGNRGVSPSSGSWDAMNLGDWQPPDPGTVQRSFDQTAREIERMRTAVRGDPATAKDFDNLLREVERLDPRKFAADPKQLLALEQKLLGESEQAELILRRKLDGDGQVRTPAPENIPPGYGTAVAEYFKRLSQ